MARRRQFWTPGDPLNLGLLLALTVSSMFGQATPTEKPQDNAATIAMGAELFSQHCAVCHGNDLTGNGAFPKPYRVPPDLTTLAKRHGGKFPDEYVSKVLRNGATLPAHAPAEMPLWSATTALTKEQKEERIRNLTEFIKSRQTK